MQDFWIINSSLTCLNLCGHDLFTSNLAPGDVWKIPPELELGIGQSRKVRSGAKHFFANPKTPGGVLQWLERQTYGGLESYVSSKLYCILWPWVTNFKSFSENSLFPNRTHSFSLQNLFHSVSQCYWPPTSDFGSPLVSSQQRHLGLLRPHQLGKWKWNPGGDWNLGPRFAVQEILYLRGSGYLGYVNSKPGL